MNFISDNTTSVCPEVFEALLRVNPGTALGYGEDEVTRRMARAFDEVFETHVTVFPVATGTAANALAFSVLTPPWGAIYCHEHAHVAVDECGAPEFFTGGAKLITLGGAHGKLNPADLDATIARLSKGDPHQVQPAAVSLTQATEAGTVYTLADVAALVEVARRHGLAVHLDGARLANAVSFLGCTPAEMTWRVGVDVLSFGATKNGALAAEAVVFFREELVRDFVYRRKRSGHLFSKMRYISAQLEAYLTDGLWLKNAAHANALAVRLAEGLAALPGITIEHPMEANAVFVRLPDRVMDSLLAHGYTMHGGGNRVTRLVTAFNTQPSEVDAFLAAARAGALGDQASVGGGPGLPRSRK